MINFNFNFKNVFNFKKKVVEKKLQEISKEYDIKIIPINDDFNLENLFPLGNNVKYWSTFVVGRNKQYILSHANKELQNVESENNLNIPDKLFKFLDGIWDLSFKDQNIQLFLIINEKLFILNSYCLKNRKGDIIGCVAFIRNFNPDY